MPATALILIDGLRPDAISPAASPNVLALMERGVSTLRAASVMPSITLPVHTSIFHSVPLARLLPGLAPHAAWEGRCVDEIFD